MIARRLWVASISSLVTLVFACSSRPSGESAEQSAGAATVAHGGATAQPVLTSGTSDATLLIAYQANDPSHQLYVSNLLGGVNLLTQTAGVGYQSTAAVAGNSVGAPPAMALFGGKLYIAYEANDPSDSLYLAASSDGAKFSTSHLAGNTLGSAASIAATSARLYIGYRDPGSNELVLTSSTDGASFSAPAAVPSMVMGSAPAMVIYEGDLVVAYQGNDGTNTIYLARSYDGATLQPPYWAGSGIAAGTAPALAVTEDGDLVLAFQQTNRQLYIGCSSDHGQTFNDEWVPPVYMGSAPAVAAFSDTADGVTSQGLAVAYQADDRSHTLYVLITGTHGEGVGLGTSFGSSRDSVGSTPTMVALPRAPPTPPSSQRCAGLPQGASCSSDSECCHEDCEDGRCAACVAPGGACAEWWQCCTGLCSTGGDGTVGSCACLQAGTPCSSDGECCDGACNQSGPNANGTETVPVCN